MTIFSQQSQENWHRAAHSFHAKAKENRHAAMMLSDADITIAITVYDRREFIQQAVLSALNQTQPVKVIVVEDCGPDAGLQDFVLERFGSRITYHRNPRRRGLFDNWNACIE